MDFFSYVRWTFFSASVKIWWPIFHGPIFLVDIFTVAVLPWTIFPWTFFPWTLLPITDSPWTVPDLWLTGDHFAGKLSAICQPTRPTQPSIPSGLANEQQSMILHWLRRWKPLNSRPGRLWMQAKVCVCRLGCSPAVHWLCLWCTALLQLQYKAYGTIQSGPKK